jgi:hypothetical protein
MEEFNSMISRTTISQKFLIVKMFRTLKNLSMKGTCKTKIKRLLLHSTSKNRLKIADNSINGMSLKKQISSTHFFYGRITLIKRRFLAYIKKSLKKL